MSCRTSRLCPHHTSVLSLSMYTYFRCHVVPLVSALITLLFSLSLCIHTLGVMSYLSSLPSSHFCFLSLCIHTLAHHVVPHVSALITLLFSLSMYTYFRCHVVPLVSALITLLFSLSLCIHTLAHHVVPHVSALITRLFSLSMYTYFSSSCRTSRLCPHHTSVLSLHVYIL